MPIENNDISVRNVVVSSPVPPLRVSRLKRNAKQFTCIWKVYPKLLSKTLHLASKALTHTVEATNSLIRHYLARFHRKTKCYSKSIQRVEQSLLLFQHRKKLIMY